MKKLKLLANLMQKMGEREASFELLKLASSRPHFLSREHLERMASLAQAIYDDWIQDEKGYSFSHGEIGYGGICHLIADSLVDYLFSLGLSSKHNFCSVSSNFEQHVYVLAWFPVEGDSFSEAEAGAEAEEPLYDLYSLDIPYAVYERGGGFTWSKIDGVKFSGADISVELIESFLSLEDLEKYLES